jgi:hypothetical protein
VEWKNTSAAVWRPQGLKAYATDNIVLIDSEHGEWVNCQLLDYEDFTLVKDIYDKGDITLEGPQVIGLRGDLVKPLGVYRNCWDYIYKDYGEDYFGDFRCDVDLELTALTAAGGYSFFSMSNILDVYPTHHPQNGTGIQASISGEWYDTIRISEGSLNSAVLNIAVHHGHTFNVRLERVNKVFTATLYTDDTYTQISDQLYSDPGTGDATVSLTTENGATGYNKFRYLYPAAGWASPFYTAPYVAGESVGHTLCLSRGTTWARTTHRPTAEDTIVLSDTAPEPRGIWRGNCSDAIVFNDTAEIIGTFQGRAEDTIEFSDGPPRVAWIETLTEGIVFGDSTIWIRPFNKDEIDVQPKMVDFTFKAIAKITNFKAFKKQLATDAIELSLAAPIKIKPQTTDFKALNVVSDFKATEKKFDTTDNSLRRGLK